MNKRINVVEFAQQFRIFTDLKFVTQQARDNAEQHLQTLLERLPKGNGLDKGVLFNWQDSRDNKLIFQFSFHHISNGAGYDDGWTQHTLIVNASLVAGYELRISGKNKNDVKDYLYDLFNDFFIFQLDTYGDNADRES